MYEETEHGVRWIGACSQRMEKSRRVREGKRNKRGKDARDHIVAQRNPIQVEPLPTLPKPHPYVLSLGTMYIQDTLTLETEGLVCH